MPEKFESSPIDKRRAGVVLHPTSLPGHGVLGSQAYLFIDWLQKSGLTVWQVLPLGPTHQDGSPYQCLSVHAGNPSLISVGKLAEQGWLSDATKDAYENGKEEPAAVLLSAFSNWRQRGTHQDRDSYHAFVASHTSWLEDYALYVVLREQHNGACWADWPESLRDRHGDVLDAARQQHRDAIELVYFEQYVFYQQWTDLKRYANERGIKLFGDMPIFVAYDSADVWAHRECFQLDDFGRPKVVAGVPPDYFSATGQRWGNPLYDWAAQEADGFAWWLARFESQLALYDWIRVDHFRGFAAYWEIAATCATAMEGHWVKAPGDQLFAAMLESFGSLPLVAEDLGIITEDVVHLRKKYALPGMKILQFAFGEDASNPYLPHNHEDNCVVYTGTHDNDTTLGWYRQAPPHVKAHVDAYLGEKSDEISWSLIRCVFRSVACLAMAPMQDFLALDSEHRMNTPGTAEGNWAWRFSWEQVDDDLAPRIRALVDLYGR